MDKQMYGIIHEWCNYSQLFMRPLLNRSQFRVIFGVPPRLAGHPWVKPFNFKKWQRIKASRPPLLNYTVLQWLTTMTIWAAVWIYVQINYVLRRFVFGNLLIKKQVVPHALIRSVRKHLVRTNGTSQMRLTWSIDNYSLVQRSHF